MDRNKAIILTARLRCRSLSARRAWIEILYYLHDLVPQYLSLSARRAWIEIRELQNHFASSLVALRKESVDRNKYVVQCRKMLGVALRKESVDRNNVSTNNHVRVRQSLSARRAWIEMSHPQRGD